MTTDPIDPEVLRDEEARTPTDLVAGGATIMRIENETMSAIAVQRPRQEEEILRRALSELKIVPALAERCFYSIPYEDRRSGRTTHVTGASINAARNLARRWGNCAVKTMFTSEDDDKIILAGVFTDLETNFREERLFTVSRWQHRRDGPPVRIANERLVTAIQAGASKAERNAILAGLPDWLTQSYYNAARKLAATEAKGNLSAITEAFLAQGVTREMLEKNLGKRLNALEDDDLANLRGMLNALIDGEATPESIFGGKRNGNEKPKAAGVEEVLAGGAEVTGGTTKGAEPAKPAEEPKAAEEPAGGGDEAPASGDAKPKGWF